MFCGFLLSSSDISIHIHTTPLSFTHNIKTSDYLYCFVHYRVLEKFYVGELIDNEMPVFPEQG